MRELTALELYNHAVEAIAPHVERVTAWEYLITCDPRYLPPEHRLRPPPPMASPTLHDRHRQRVKARYRRWGKAMQAAIAEYEIALQAMFDARRAAECSGYSFDSRHESQIMRRTRAPERKRETFRAVLINDVRETLRANGAPDGHWKGRHFSLGENHA